MIWILKGKKKWRWNIENIRSIEEAREVIDAGSMSRSLEYGNIIEGTDSTFQTR